MRRVLFGVTALTWVALGAEQDLYPDARKIIKEAESAASGISVPADRQNAYYSVANDYARAGYLTDVDRLSKVVLDSPSYFWRAHALYGDLAGAEKMVTAISDLDERARNIAYLGDFLWKMGEPEKARIRFETARRLAPGVANLAHRKQLLLSVQRGLQNLSSEPPERYSPTPTPRISSVPEEESTVAMFPMTTDGFRNLGTKDVAQRAAANIEFMNKLFSRIVDNDVEGVTKIAKEAATPFQKSMGIASIEHILIQTNHPKVAEQFALEMPELDSDCLLAKAEALNAAGAAWARSGNSERAVVDFEGAMKVVDSVKDLAWGKVVVALAIAKEQIKAGMINSAGTSLKHVRNLALAVPTNAKVQRQPTFPGAHYRHEAYRKSFEIAILARDLGEAREIAQLWNRSDEREVRSIVRAWLAADQYGDGLSFAWGITDSAHRSEALRALAEYMLDLAGAPRF